MGAKKVGEPGGWGRETGAGRKGAGRKGAGRCEWGHSYLYSAFGFPIILMEAVGEGGMPGNAGTAAQLVTGHRCSDQDWAETGRLPKQTLRWQRSERANVCLCVGCEIWGWAKPQSPIAGKRCTTVCGLKISSSTLYPAGVLAELL